MTSLSEAAMSVIVPFAGAMVAGMCIRATATAAGKDAESLSAADIPVFKECATGILHSLAPYDAIGRLMADVERQVS
ncbi:MAG: hypothetical protein FDZ75_08375 [Actinobacteria bacterium]|nr:MAG: hypothetical protein FDZ75_08375 [Actinomycetota bacterium]